LTFTGFREDNHPAVCGQRGPGNSRSESRDPLTLHNGLSLVGIEVAPPCPHTRAGPLLVRAHSSRVLCLEATVSLSEGFERCTVGRVIRVHPDRILLVLKMPAYRVTRENKLPVLLLEGRCRSYRALRTSPRVGCKRRRKKIAFR